MTCAANNAVRAIRLLAASFAAFALVLCCAGCASPTAQEESANASAGTAPSIASPLQAKGLLELDQSRIEATYDAFVEYLEDNGPVGL